MSTDMSDLISDGSRIWAYTRSYSSNTDTEYERISVLNLNGSILYSSNEQAVDPVIFQFKMELPNMPGVIEVDSTVRVKTLQGNALLDSTILLPRLISNAHLKAQKLENGYFIRTDIDFSTRADYTTYGATTSSLGALIFLDPILQVDTIIFESRSDMNGPYVHSFHQSANANTVCFSHPTSQWPYDTLTIEIFDRQWKHQSTVSVNQVFGDADPDFYNTQINFFFADGDTLIICGTNIFENGCEYFTEAYSVSNDSILWSNTQYIDCEAWLFCNFYFDDSYRKSDGNLIYSVNAPFFTGYSSWLLRLSIDGQVDTLRENSTGNFERNFARLLNHNGIVYTLNHVSDPWSNSSEFIIEALLDSATISTLEYAEVGLEVFPNPSAGRVTLRSTQNIEEVRVYNSFGVEVYRSDMFDGTEAQFYLQDLSAGTYFIHCGQGNGIVGVEKLVLYR